MQIGLPWVIHTGCPGRKTLSETLLISGVSRVTTFASMGVIKHSGTTRLVQVRAVTANYPFFGEITTEAYVHLPALVRETIARIGYTEAGYGFDAHTCAVMSTIDQQSADIALGVDAGGAGDQGMMFGYACDETEELMPLPITLAHRLARALADRRKDGTLPWLRPDGKSQVSVLYENGRPLHVDTVVIATQHSDAVFSHGICPDCLAKELAELDAADR